MLHQVYSISLHKLNFISCKKSKFDYTKNKTRTIHNGKVNTSTTWENSKTASGKNLCITGGIFMNIMPTATTMLPIVSRTQLQGS